MNKLTKYGLTALAGSLVATSVSAGELGVSGSWSWSYDSADSDESGQPMSMGDSVTFSGSGETDQGWTAGVSYELDGGTFDDYKLTLDMIDPRNLSHHKHLHNLFQDRCCKYRGNAIDEFADGHRMA